MTIFYAYWLGLFMISPFANLSTCEASRHEQVTWGASKDISECWVIVDARRRTTYHMTSPTYSAPFTPEEAVRRQ